MDVERLTHAQSPTRKPESVPVNTASRCDCVSETSDEDQLHNDRLDDIAFDDHLIETVYRKRSPDYW